MFILVRPDINPIESHFLRDLGFRAESIAQPYAPNNGTINENMI